MKPLFQQMSIRANGRWPLVVLCMVIVTFSAQAQWPCPNGGAADTAFASRLHHAFECATTGCCKDVAELFLQTNDTAHHAPAHKARILLMQALLGQEDVKKRLARLSRALPLAEAHGDEQAVLWAHILLAAAYAETPDSECFGRHCVELQRRLDAGLADTAAIVNACLQLTGFHAIGGNMERATEAAHRAYLLGRNAPVERVLNGAHLNLAYLMYSLGRADSAFHHAAEGLELASMRGYPYMEARAAQIMGFVHHDKGRYADYLTMAERSLEAILRTGSALYIANGYQQLGNALNKNGRHDEAREAAAKGLAYHTDNLPLKRELLRVMVEAADSLGDHREAYRLQRELSDLKDDIHAQELEQKLERLNAQYETERKDARIAELETEHLKAANRTQRLLLMGISLMLMLTVAAGIAIIVNRARRQRAERLLNEQQRENDRQMLEAVEDERRRISAILHDTVAGSLSGLTYLTDYIAGLAHDTEKQQQELRLMHKRLDGLYAQVRDLSHELMPLHGEEGQTFCQQLEAFVERRFSPAPSHISVELWDCDTLDALPEVMRMVVFRFVQEGLSNAVRHAGAETITLAAFAEDGRITITVTDDGIGMGDGSGGIGLEHLAHLAKRHGARFQVGVPDGGGTRLELSINP